jgi:lysophospholipase L1-like esterase
VTAPGTVRPKAAGTRAPALFMLAALLAAAVAAPGSGAEPGPVLVAFGDSITKGLPDPWPEVLQARLQLDAPNAGWRVINAGIPGNRLLGGTQDNPSGLARFDQDALGAPGVRFVVLLEGINDIGWLDEQDATKPAAGAGALITAYRALIERAHAHGIKVFGGTLTPFDGTEFPGYYAPRGEAVRSAVNAWIRTGGAFDAVIDFDAALRDPADPAHLLPEFDSGDHLHPSRAGEAAMAALVEPILLGYAK